MAQPVSPNTNRPLLPELALLVLVLSLLSLLLFHRSLETDSVMFSNDGPLAAISAKAAALPEGFFGAWADLNWLGFEQISASPNVTGSVSALLGPIYFSKFYTPISLFFLGVCAWICFRQMRFHPVVCVLGALAAALNMNVFSNSCWGLASRAITLGSAFLAVASLYSGMIRRPVVKAMLAGLAVGMAVMEGYDVGAMFSVFLAAFAFFIVLINGRGEPGVRAAKGLGAVVLMALCAGFISAYTLNVLIETQIKGIAGTQQDSQTKDQRFEYATQWSLPKIEALRVIVPGLFGYRMQDEFNQPYKGSYWGTVGQQADFDKAGGLARHSGSGEYAGLLVVMMAFWALFQSLRGRHSPYSPWERKCIWFWSWLALITLFMAFGKHTPLYRVVYNVIPYFSTVRNPIKFMHPFHLAVLMLFGYGLQDLVVRYLVNPKPKAGGLFEQVKLWWRALNGFDKKWIFGCLGWLAVSLLGLLLLAAMKPDIITYLQKTGYSEKLVPGLAAKIGQFAIAEYCWYLLFLVLTTAFVAVTMSGAFAGRYVPLAGFLLGSLLFADLGRANSFWIVYENYKDKLASNAVIDVLRDKPYEHRVTAPKFQYTPELNFFHEFHHMEWLQHHFQFYNIQSMDLAQMRSPPEDMIKFENALRQNYLRRWQLTNTRYVLTVKDFVEILNQQMDPLQHRFQPVLYFNLAQLTNGFITAVTNTVGPYCLVEFKGALPRVQLYSNWIVNTDSDALLKQLVDPAFDPAQTVLVGSQIPAPSSITGAPLALPKVEFTLYTPKEIKFATDAAMPTVLLLNDKFTAHWNVWVDGKPDTVLRCNSVMRGVYLPAGRHEVRFHYEPPIRIFYVSLAAIGMGLLLCAFLAVDHRRAGPAPIPEAPVTPPTPTPTKPNKASKK